jgi:menaquinol-cytochrome c reductase iron-sulfur subunit
MAEMDERLEPGDEHASGPVSRRRVWGLLGWTAAIAAAMGAMVGYPVFRLFAAPLVRMGKGEEGTWVPLQLSPKDLSEGEQREVKYTYQHQDGWYTATRTSRAYVGMIGSDLVVFSPVCTHLRCGVTWEEKSKSFVCPCHGGVFNALGNVTAGPPPEPLKKLKWRLNDAGLIEVLEV